MRFLPALVTVCLPLHVLAAETTIPTAQLQFFEKSIRPLFANHCYRCHGPKKQRADLRLDSRQALLKGGSTGPAIIPGKPSESLLIKAIQHIDEDLQMPPSKKLSPRQIRDLTQWVKIGAPFPEATVKVDRAKSHWAFQPLKPPDLPALQNKQWLQSPIDHFILAQLEKHELKPLPPASPRHLIRRITFNLTGLPPEPEQIEQFLLEVKTNREKAIDNLIDRLLDSPEYGERWGRHWLDVARYADSNGLDENIAHGNAWRYRDYVVEAFNCDKPFDRFLLEQLAGDLLPSTSPRDRQNQLIATGFLSLGPKVLAEVDETKMEMDIIDEQIDTVGRAFLGLTLGCARCHDHKFDPIQTEDYYALAGIFRSTQTMESFKKIAKWYEHPLSSKEHEKKIADHKKAIEFVTAQINNLKKNGKPQSLLLKDLQAKLKKLTPEPLSAMGVKDGKVLDAKVLLRGSHLTKGKVVPRRVPLALSGPKPPTFDNNSSGRFQLARWMVSHPLTARVIVNRIWRWHFGKGLVRTTDNFGLLGDHPTHPQLLEWLANRFIKSGWSIKKLHKLILRSSTYQQSTGATSPKDPSNRFYSRFDLRRLEAEAIRDAMLKISGLLDPKRGGSLLHVKNREFLFNHTSEDNTRYHSRRRTIYLPVIRNHLYDMLSLFDCTDATVLNGNRATTTVPTQALFLLNSRLMAEVSNALATRIRDLSADPAQRMKALYLLAVARPPTEQELARNSSYLKQMTAELNGSEQKAWASLCQILLASNEFVYLR